MKNRIILTMIYDVKLFPPVMSICNILSELNYEIVYIGSCSDATVKKKFIEDNHVKFYNTHPYGGNGFQRVFQQSRYREQVFQILKTEYIQETTYLWLLHSETVSLFSGVLDRYNTISHLFEFKNPTQKLAYKLLSPFSSFETNLKKSQKIVCCEYNRAHITRAIYNLDRLPYILPNKPYDKDTDKLSALPTSIQEIVSKYSGKKVILYQGIFIPERKVDDFIEAVNLLSDDYVLFLMGGGNSFYDDLKSKYQSERIVFLPFLPPPLHLEITKLAHIGILVYVVNGVPINHAINVLYCAPNKLYEYSKFGVPMIANDLPALNMVFSQNMAGTCLQTLSAKEISKTILAIDSDYDKYSEASYQLYNSIDMVNLVRTIVSDED